MTFEGESGSFRKVKITGSRTQKESEEHYKNFRKFLKEGDSVLRITMDESLPKEIRKSANEKYKANYSWRRKVDYDYIDQNPNSIFGVHLLDFYATTFGKEKTKKLYSKLSKKIKETSYGRSISKYLEVNQDIRVGSKYVDFSLNDVDGKTVKLSDFQGKIVLLDFWNTNCGPCIQEFPFLKNAYQEFKNKGFEIVGVSDDKSEEKWSKMIQQKELSWVNLRNKNKLESTPHLIYGINGIPDNFLINQQGVIVARRLKGEKLIEKLQELTK